MIGDRVMVDLHDGKIDLPADQWVSINVFCLRTGKCVDSRRTRAYDANAHRDHLDRLYGERFSAEIEC